MTPILIIERWPTIPVGGGETHTSSGYKKAESEDGKWWLVREAGWFKRWRWRPVNGQFVTMQHAKEDRE
jgi:hypothetical protein